MASRASSGVGYMAVPGRLTGVSVDAEGIVFARFTNGQSTSLGKLALACRNQGKAVTHTLDGILGQRVAKARLGIGVPGDIGEHVLHDAQDAFFLGEFLF